MVQIIEGCEKEGVWVVTLVGEIDLHRQEELRDACDEGVDAGHTGIVVDFSSTTFIDSTSLGVLVRTQKRLKRRKGMLYLAVPTANVRKIFEITALDRVLSFHGSI